jgi:hypothetical protein
MTVFAALHLDRTIVVGLTVVVVVRPALHLDRTIVVGLTVVVVRPTLNLDRTVVYGITVALATGLPVVTRPALAAIALVTLSLSRGFLPGRGIGPTGKHQRQ